MHDGPAKSSLLDRAYFLFCVVYYGWLSSAFKHILPRRVHETLFGKPW